MTEYHYKTIAQNIRTRISSRELKHGDRLPTDRDLARQWDVTPVTVSKAMRELVDEGLIVRLRGRRGSFVNIQQTTVNKPSSDQGMRRVGIVYSWFVSSGYYQNALLQGIADTIVPEDRIFALPYSGFHHYSQLVEQENLDGLILLSPPEQKRDEVQALVDSNIPFVVIGGTWEQEPDWPCIDSDGRAMGTMAAEHMLACGYEKISVVVCSTQLSNNRLRLEAFLDRMAMAQKQVPSDWLLIEPQPSDSNCAISQMLSAKRRPDAVFAGGYLLAESVANVATNLGMRIPTDLAIMGCDAGSDGRLLNRFPLSTVTQPLLEMGRKGMRAFIDRLDGKVQKIAPSLLPVTLVRGVTTMPSSASRRNVQAGVVNSVEV